MSLLRGILGLIIGVAVLAAHAQDNDQHTLNLQNVEIETLVDTVSDITGRNFVLHPQVTGNVRVVSSTPLSASEIYEVFLSILRVHGFAAVPAGDFVKIVPETAARSDAIRTGPGAVAGDELVTRIIALQHVEAGELVTLLRPLVPQNAQLVAHPASNVLLIADRAANVERVRQIIQRIDRASEDGIEVVALQHAGAAEVVRMLNALGGPNNGPPPALADERTNSILLSGEPSQRLRLKTLISHLDTPLQSGEESTQVVYLRYADAVDLVPILENVSRTLRNENAPFVTSEEADSTQLATIQAHEDTNSLVISTSPAILRALNSVIRQLDIPRAQVHVEAIIAEVSDDLTREIGIQWQASEIDSINDEGVVGGTNFGSPGLLDLAGFDNPIAALGALGGGLNLGYLAGTLTLADGTEVPQLSVLARAFASDGDTNVLSTPSLITLDHEEALINVGQEVPFLTGQFTNTGTDNASVNPFQTIDREDVGVKLVVTPHINEGDAVILELVQEVSSIAGQGSAVDLITNKREIATRVMVPDGGILVIGGLVDDTLDETIQKVPGLGDIPLVGNLFKFRSTRKTKRNLMVFIRPTILRDNFSQMSITGAKYNFIRDEQIRAQEENDGLLRSAELPLLPELEDLVPPQ